MITADEIRQKYPTPCTVAYVDSKAEGMLTALNTPEIYCVGGALGKVLFDDKSPAAIPFPSRAVLSEWLTTANPRLSAGAPRLANMYAHAIITENDNGHFDKAWDELDEALRFGDFIPKSLAPNKICLLF